MNQNVYVWQLFIVVIVIGIFFDNHLQKKTDVITETNSMRVKKTNERVTPLYH